MELPIAQKSCGTCTKCCEGYLEIEIYGEKSHGFPCRFMKPSYGCSIYENRPESPCRSYSCLWLSDPDFPMWLKPEYSGIISDLREQNGIYYISIVEAGKELTAKGLSYIQAYALRKNLNVLWFLDNIPYWIGSPAFVDMMDKKYNGKK